MRRWLDNAMKKGIKKSFLKTERKGFLRMWHFSPRLALGAILLEAGRAVEAETVYWDDLRHRRENGWALFGLMQSLRAQEKTQEAELVEAHFKKAWSNLNIAPVAGI